LLTETGTHILKFYLHISKAEQKQRFLERQKDPEKHWKFSVGDLAVREQWEEYMRAYEAVLQGCNTEYAPWHIVPANHKWYRDLVVARAVAEALEKMKPEYPRSDVSLDKVTIPD
jgi:polyphosphate kinase 2 (PPK2 family)